MGHSQIKTSQVTMLRLATVFLLVKAVLSAPAGPPAGYTVPQVPIGSCVTGGDPYYTTFDGEKLEFQGRCNYKLMGTKENVQLPGELRPFTVLVNNQKALGSERAYTDKVHIDVMLHRFSLRDNGQIFIDDIPRTSDAQASVISNITLTRKLHAWKEGSMVFVRADNMFTLSTDLRGPSGRHVITIWDVNPEYKGVIEGMCGNFDGERGNDHVPKGMEAPGTSTEIGNSWIMDSGECV